MKFNEIKIKCISTALYLDPLEETYSSIQIHLKVNEIKLNMKYLILTITTEQQKNCSNVFN